MKKNLKKLLTSILLLSSVSFFGQTVLPTLEWTASGSNQALSGPSLNPIVVNFLRDLQNPIVPTNAPTYTFDPNPLIATLSLRNQTRSTTLTGTATIVQGITFGGRNTDDNSISSGSDDPLGTPGIQTIGSAKLYNVFAAEIPASKPLNNMYVTSPLGTNYGTTSNTSGGSGAAGGFDTEASTGAQGPAAVDFGGIFGGDDDANFGVPIYLTTEPLADLELAADEKYLYGELVITFNRPVNNPVVHLAGLGGSYTYQASPAAGGGIFNTNFTTELQLVNAATTGVLQLKAGNLNFAVNNNNEIININPFPNAGSVIGDATYGAASGSVQVNGTFSQLVFKVYMKGVASNFGWSQTASNILNANRDPMNGDVWYISVSTNKPTQQISGNVFYDKDGLSGDIWRSTAGVVYETTDGSDSTNVFSNNRPGVLYANLIDNTTGLVIESTPISKDGSYLFDNVAIGSYKVALGGGPSPIGSVGPTNTQGYPTGWINTGQQNGLITGTDGNNDGISGTVTIIAGDVKSNVNFGVDYNTTLPVDLLNFNGTLNNQIAILKWVVSREVDFSKYELERSNDGVNYAKIATVDARRIANQQQTYTQNDDLSGKNGKFYYRLKMINLDNSFKYSNIVIVRLGKIKFVEIYPNPFMETIKVEMETKVSEKIVAKIKDINGVLIISQEHNVQIGVNQLTISNLAKLAQGTYILEIVTSTETIIEKIVKLK